MSLEGEWAVAITTIIANIVTILGIVTLISIAIKVLKNRFSTKTISLLIKQTGDYPNYNTNKRHLAFSIDILNSTNKVFFVTGIIFELDGKNFNLSSENKNYPNDNIIRNICISAFEAKTITGWIEIPIYFNLPTTTDLKIKTTIKDLIYKVDLK